MSILTHQVEVYSPATLKTYEFLANEPVEPASNMEDSSTWLALTALPATALTAPIDYVVKVHTSDKMGAGTDAKVHLEMRGLGGSSGQLVLASAEDNQLDAGSVDEFVVSAPDVGDIDQLLITQDGAGMGSSWHLAKVSGCSASFNRIWMSLPSP